MAQNSETRNIGYEAHPLFKYYKDTNTDVAERCCTCGSENIYTRPGWNNFPYTLECNECCHSTDYDEISFVEWCEKRDIDPNDHVIRITKEFDIDLIIGIVEGMDENSTRIIIQGANWNEDI